VLTFKLKNVELSFAICLGASIAFLFPYFIRMGAQKTQSFSSDEWADEGKGVKHPLTPEAPDFSRWSSSLQ